MNVEQERIRLRGELAGLRLMMALARIELKYRADQARVPKGQAGGGRFAPEHGVGRAGRAFAPPIAAAAAGRAATVAAPEAGILAGAEGAAALTAGAGGAMLGSVGVSRAAGLAAVQSGAATGMTPILGLPIKPAEGALYLGGPDVRSPPISLEGRETCEADYDDEVTQCYDALGLKRRTYNPGNDPLRACIESANDRLADCIRRGAPGRSTIPLRLPSTKRGG